MFGLESDEEEAESPLEHQPEGNPSVPMPTTPVIDAVEALAGETSQLSFENLSPSFLGRARAGNSIWSPGFNAVDFV